MGHFCKLYANIDYYFYFLIRITVEKKMSTNFIIFFDKKSRRISRLLSREIRRNFFVDRNFFLSTNFQAAAGALLSLFVVILLSIKL